MRLDKEQALKILASEGPLKRFFKGFEIRDQQAAMMGDIIDAYNQSEIALIEAGTGTGKSLAYLIPAILWQQKFKERTVISTNTINLQEQLLHKDIPLAVKALNVECKAVIVKGMGNYVCLRKCDELRQELLLMTPQEKVEWDQIEQWLETTSEGSRSSLAFVPSTVTWEKVGAEHDTCNHKDCPHYKNCFYFKARREAADANLLIVNHHLLCSDLVSRNEDVPPENPLLPHYTRVILDEAHNFEEIATDFFASRISQTGLMRTLAKLSSEKHGKAIGKLNILKQQIHDCTGKGNLTETASLLNRLTVDLPTQRWDIWHFIERTCHAFLHFARLLGSKSDEENVSGEMKLRLLPFHQTHPFWISDVSVIAKEFIEMIQKFVLSLHALAQDLKQLKNEKLSERTQHTLFDIQALGNRLSEGASILQSFIDSDIPSDKVLWLEFQANRSNTSLFNADLDISHHLEKSLFDRVSTVVLVSATLTTNKSFDFMRQRLGLNQMKNKVIKGFIYEAPFDYQKQALFAIPTDLPIPTHPDFTHAAVEAIWKIVQASRGNAFILFTSYSMLKTCYEKLQDRLRGQRFHPLKQGDTNRQALIAQFKNTDRSVLFGTDSFWEGVDVAGEALRCVVIVKLPFKVPTEPIIQARSEAILANHGDPFFDYSLPNAIVKFKQGFGRLIRHKKDRGCIVCLDQRVLTKGYGSQFLNSLPNCQQLFSPLDQVQKQMEEFYRKTYYLVK